jgi:hypothetical protein
MLRFSEAFSIMVFFAKAQEERLEQLDVRYRFQQLPPFQQRDKLGSDTLLQ